MSLFPSSIHPFIHPFIEQKGACLLRGPDTDKGLDEGFGHACHYFLHPSIRLFIQSLTRRELVFSGRAQSIKYNIIYIIHYLINSFIHPFIYTSIYNLYSFTRRELVLSGKQILTRVQANGLDQNIYKLGTHF